MKRLGKIMEVEFGRVNDRPFFFGIKLSFGGAGWGISDTTHFVNMYEGAKWKNKNEKRKAMETIMNYVYYLLEEADVDNVSDLLGKPVEVEIENNSFKDFRILKEVL